MGRTRLHGDDTAAALLDAAERVLAAEGPDAVTVRGVADAIGTTTRSVYSTYGSKEALLAALGSRAFDMLGTVVRALPVTDDPAADLMRAATDGFRGFAREHPALFQLGVQQTWLPTHISSSIVIAAGRALTALHERLERAQQIGALGDRSIEHAAVEFHALCEGLAGVELRGFLPAPTAKTVWDDAFAALIAGWRATS